MLTQSLLDEGEDRLHRSEPEPERDEKQQLLLRPGRGTHTGGGGHEAFVDSEDAADHVDVQCSGMFCCGRWWYVSPFEFILPSLCLGMIRAPTVLWAGVLWGSASALQSLEGPEAARSHLNPALLATCFEGMDSIQHYLAYTCIFYTASYTGFVLLSVIWCLHRDLIVTCLIYSKLAFLFFDASWCVLGCIFLRSLDSDSSLSPCFDTLEPPGPLLQDMRRCTLVCVCLGFISTALDLWFIRTVYNPSSSKYNCWGSICSWLLCPFCWQLNSEFNFSDNPNLFNDMAEHLRAVFGGVRGVTVSDVAYSLALVHKLQVRRTEAGNIYLDPDIQALDVKGSSGRRDRNARVGDGADQKSRASDDANSSIKLSIISDKRQPPGQAAAIDEERIESEKKRLVEAVLNGVQPHMTKESWADFEEIKHHLKFALAACGWPMALYMEPCSAYKYCGCSCCGDCLGCELEVGDSLGSTCCQSNERAFISITGIKPEDLLFASMVADLERLYYYVCVDRTRRNLVVAIRGTMSFQDMATDARQRYVSLFQSDPEHVVPEGFLMSSKRIINEINDHEGVQRFLRENTDYGIVFTGHSLGGGASCIAAILLSKNPKLFRKVKAYAIAPPPSVDKQFGCQDRWKGIIKSVVFRDDIVPRMCLHNLFRLRSQALASFRKCSDPAKSVFHGFRDLSNCPTVGKYQSFDFPHVRRTTYDEKNVPELVVPGRVYHLLGAPKAYPCFPLCCNPCIRWPIQYSSCSPQVAYNSVVYPASQETFREVRVTANMLLDHFPHRYANAIRSIEVP